jgi:molecular chaperone GrpE
MSEHTTDNDKDSPGGDAPDVKGEATPPDSADVLAEAVDTGNANAPEAANDSGAGPGDEPDTDAADIDPQAARIAELEAELAKQKEQALRALAEAENMRKRADKQVQDASRYGASSFARDMLVVADNLERALAAVPETGPNGEHGEEQGADLLPQLREGVQMTLRDLESKLESHSVKKVEPELGEKFDHNLHQAMFEAETGDYPAGTIAQVVQPGYVLHDRLLRAAMVGVAKAPAAVAPAETPVETPVEETPDAAENNDAA